MEHYDIAIIGGGMGGVAAALAACDAGARVVLSEPTDWPGGQMTSQGVSALDEHRHIERAGGTRSYMALREAIRDHYRRRFGVAAMPDGAPLNPGNAWVSALCFEPAVGVAAIDALLAPHVAAGRLTLLMRHELVAADAADGVVRSVTLRAPDGSAVTVAARLFLDATEAGDLLPLIGAEYVVGAEARSDTGEADAPDEARPHEIQGFTFCFAVEYCPGEDHTIAKPEGYEQLRDAQPFTLTLTTRSGEARPFRVFERGPTGLPPFWTYRRLIDGALLDPGGKLRDIAMINWNSNDYHDAAIIDVSPDDAARALDAARRLSLSFLYWMQTEMERDDGGRGYPEMRLVPEVMGTADGLSKAPYIRESRRIIALKRIVADDILAAGRETARAAPFDDSCGIGWYFMDLHPAPGNPRSLFEPTLPFQIPLGALIPRQFGNLLAACKNIGTTHLSNGSYRLHPVEWNIGEAAGALAAHCIAEDVAPREVWADRRRLRAFQAILAARGVALGWALDVPHEHPQAPLIQRLLAAGAIADESARSRTLEINLAAPCTGADAAALARAAADILGKGEIAVPLRWAAEPDSAATRDEWAPVLAALGAAADGIGAAPGWGEIVAGLKVEG
jgi:hypothetical protein